MDVGFAPLNWEAAAGFPRCAHGPVRGRAGKKSPKRFGGGAKEDEEEEADEEEEEIISRQTQT